MRAGSSSVEGEELRTKYVSGVLLSILLVTSLIALPSFVITITSQTVSASSSSENFTIVALPDTQYYSSSYPAIFDNQTNWIAKNENGMIQNENAQNIVFVSHLGDIVDTANNITQWQNADAAMKILDNKVLYGILPGNHDLQDGGTNYSSYFPPSRYAYWDGSYVSYGPSNNLNNYQLFSAGGMNFIALDLEYDPPADVLTWAGSVLDNYSDRRAIISTHAYLTYAGNWSQGGQNIHDNLVALHNNVFLVLCGHSYGSNGYGVWERTDTFGNRTVYQLLSDYQNVAPGGDGWLRIMKFVPSENKIYVKTYSPYAENYWTDSANQFEMSYPMSPTVAGGVSVSISPPSQENENGGTLTYTVTVMNLDNVQENYILTRGDNASWGLENLVLDNYWLLVPKGESRATKLNVTIPSNATNDTWDNIWVQATSKDNDNIWDNESCLAHMARTWTQASWSGGPTTPSLEVGTWSPSYDNFYRGENVDSSAGVRLSLPSTTGWLESSIFDAGSIADWGVVKWDASTPSSGSSDNYVSSYSAVKGTVTNFDNQKSADDEGAYSTLAEESVTTQTSNNRGLYQDISATAGTSYTESAWVYSPAGTGSGGMGIVFTFFKSDGSYTSSSNAYNSSTSVWQQVTVTATAPALTVDAAVRVRGYANSANPAGYADNLKFYVTSAPGTNLLSNPSLESWTGGVPDNWIVENIDFRILQENVQVKDGSYSARIDTLFYTYDMQINENIASVPSATTQTLQLRYELANANDTFNVQVWNGSAWNTRGSSLSSTSWTDWSYTLLSSEVIGGTVQVRFVDNNPSSTSQDNILIDYLRVESYSAPWSASIVVKLRTNTTAGDSDPYDGGWSDWYPHNNEAENTLMENGRYIQYRVELSTTDNTRTPELSKITLNYEFLAGPILPENIEWIRQFGTSADDRAYGMAVGGSHNVYVAGITGGTLSGQTSSGGNDAFVRKYDGAGNEIWTRQFGSSADDYAMGVAVDNSDNVYITGITWGALPGKENLGGTDAFVRKYDGSGNEIWTIQFGTSANDRASGVVVDRSNNIYVTGYTYGALPGQTSSGDRDAFVRKYDSAGNEIWTRQFGSSAYDDVRDMAVDSSDNVYVSGLTLGALPGQTSSDNYDAFVRKYDGAGNELWTRQFGTSDEDYGYGVAVDGSDNVYVAGDTKGTLPGQTSSGGRDIFVRKYDGAGNELWTRQYGTSADDRASDATGDGSNNVYIAGHTLGTFSGQTSSGEWDALVMKYDGAGNELWTRQFGSSDNDYAWSVAVDGLENIYVAGETWGALPGQTSSGNCDAFLVKFTQIVTGEGEKSSHGPILIVGDDNFTLANGVTSGLGTVGNPYIIENYIINASTANGIEIRNTTAHFVVRNCVVENGWIAENGVNHYGIKLSNVVNGRVENCALKNNDYGILLITNSDNNALINNTCENNFWYGIRLESSSNNNTLDNNTCANTKYYGIGLDSSNNNIFDNNTCANNGGGIYLYDSENIKMRNNTLSNNRYNFGVEGTTLSHFIHDIDNSNLVNGKPIRYLIGHNNEVIGPSLEMGYLGLVNCDNIRVENLVLKHNIQGILIASTQDSRLENCKFENNGWGIYLWGSDNNVLTTNNCENGGRGIQLLTSNNNTLTNNICEDDNYFGIRLAYSNNNMIKNSTFSSDNEHGVRLYSSDNNIIENNTISNDNLDGIWFENNSNSVNNTIRNNNVTSNNRYGIYILNSNDNNRIYHNNILNNENQAYDTSSNFWDNGYPSGGNYWSDYAGVDENHGENQDIPGSDNIGDTPYSILGDSNQDRYPFMPPAIPVTGTATFKLENLYKVSLNKDLQINTGSKLVVKFYKYDATFQANSILDSITPPETVKENENVPHPRAAERYSWGTVQIATLVLTTDNENEVISTIASFTVHQSDLRTRYIAILRTWGDHPEQQSAFRTEVLDILRQWSSAPS